MKTLFQFSYFFSASGSIDKELSNVISLPSNRMGTVDPVGNDSEDGSVAPLIDSFYLSLPPLLAFGLGSWDIHKFTLLLPSPPNRLSDY